MLPINDLTRQAIELLSQSEILKAEHKRASALSERLENNRMTVSVLGQFKRGKSTFINALLGENLLPTGIVPVTSAVTVLKYGEPAAEITFENGITEKIETGELPLYVNEQENPDNQKGVAQVTVYSASEFLKNDITLVDTPGVGSFHKHNTKAAYDFVKESDVVIFMLSVDSPINQIEIDFLESAAEFSSKFYFVVNKTDVVDEDELTEYLSYCQKILCRLMNRDSVAVFPISARKGQGIDELTETLLTDCRKSARAILEDSVRMKLQDVISEAIGRTKFYWNALGMPVGRLDLRFRTLREFCAGLKSSAEKKADGIEDEFMLYTEVAEMRKALLSKVSELFGMEYKLREFEGGSGDLGARLVAETLASCDEIETTLNDILLYKEENAITVAYKLDDMNKLERNLRRLAAHLA